ncbi:SecB-like chaperone SecBL [Actinomadura meridiana]|uniref:SecB-like chaperone SecBL n=1 Tax=Actinomadura meridiana TaxID=559626 RepID=A0ABP8C6T6_9ACTN
MSGTPEEDAISIERLVEEIELKRITFFEISARRWNSDPGISEEPHEEAQTSLNVMHRVDAHSISIRCRLTLSYKEGVVVADGAAIFETRDRSSDPREVEIAEDVLVEFSRRVGIPALYPYLREAIQESARKVRMKAPVLGLLRPGSLKLEQREDEDA